MKVRIGIDVGGTFTDAVAVRGDTYELIGTVKIPTTHSAKEGVAAGIVEVLNKIMDECHIEPEDVAFIAHGTTQATNALLEGDVDQVGILTLGHGVEGLKAKADTNMGSIPLTEKKSIAPVNEFVNNAKPESLKAEAEKAIGRLREEIGRRIQYFQYLVNQEQDPYKIRKQRKYIADFFERANQYLDTFADAWQCLENDSSWYEPDSGADLFGEGADSMAEEEDLKWYDGHLTS